MQTELVLCRPMPSRNFIEKIWKFCNIDLVLKLLDLRKVFVYLGGIMI